MDTTFEDVVRLAEQLNPNVHSNLIIASVFVVETGVGKNIFDLMRLIKNKIKSNDIQARMNDIVAKTLGNNTKRMRTIILPTCPR